ncbi:hypothetical protein AC331_19615 [Salmonella enterica subsp. enterica]|uniref:hypothetical protein n=1 Tax=Salmonella enterica TaxID=28901 RepID=UPI00076B948C|nr:hypothetical protein [Salmonella enterica]EAW1595199.1 hypothetical protein [Salmonella enterica subsp. enterica]EBW5403414.1 hypothetical protein [Salmonella enterica subsp. enterica serovar Southampton]ECG6087323.1 hypothetical protein [Salmonella enterica subsp. enterica serovar Blukwa]EDR9147863.1 hypothetical protein [Salmonella enterica subsp. enterica serovar Agbeni]EEP8537282.1 hypothetical protein [Salmonella enterica subsp. enterica serovar Zega]
MNTSKRLQKVVLPHVRRLPETIVDCLDPFCAALYRERRELLLRFKEALDAAGVEYVEVDHE